MAGSYAPCTRLYTRACTMVLIALFMSWEQAVVIIISGGFWSFTQVPLQPFCAAGKPRSNHAIWAQCWSLTTSPCPTLYACAEPKSQGHCWKWLHKLKIVWCIYASIAYNWLTCMVNCKTWNVEWNGTWNGMWNGTWNGTWNRMARDLPRVRARVV